MSQFEVLIELLLVDSVKKMNYFYMYVKKNLSLAVHILAFKLF